VKLWYKLGCVPGGGNYGSRGGRRSNKKIGWISVAATGWSAKIGRETTKGVQILFRYLMTANFLSRRGGEERHIREAIPGVTGRQGSRGGYSKATNRTDKLNQTVNRIGVCRTRVLGGSARGRTFLGGKPRGRALGCLGTTYRDVVNRLGALGCS